MRRQKPTSSTPATGCTRRGMRTLVLGDERPARYTLGPHKLPIEPVTWPILPGAASERVLKELHAELALRRKLREAHTTPGGVVVRFCILLQTCYTYCRRINHDREAHNDKAGRRKARHVER